MIETLQKLPVNWNVVKIPEVAFYQEGPGVRKWQFQDSGVKLLNVGNINDGQINLSTTKLFLSEDEAYGKYAHFLVDAGDLLIACSGIVLDNFHNKICFAEEEHLPLCLNTSTMRFKTLNDSVLNLSFFKYYLQTVHFNKQLSRLITGSAQLNFGPSHIKQIDLLLPPLAEQQKIAAILDAAASLRQKDQQLVERYTALSQSLFLEMFGDPESNSKKLEERLLSEVLDLITYGLTVRPEYVQEGIPLISAREIRSGEVAFESAPKISKSDFDRLSEKAKPFKNDILFSKTGSIGHCALVKTKMDFAISQNAARLSFKPLVNPIYAMNYLKTPYFQRLSQNRAKGNAVKDLQLGDMKMFKFLLPSSILQNQFAERVQLIEAQKQQAQASLEKSEVLFNNLLQRAFTGVLTAKMAA